jgi:hypothetical protein
MRLRELWWRITSTRYTRALEEEVRLLRAENRGLLNSILGIAGVPPMPALTAGAAAEETSEEAGRVALRESARSAQGSLSRRGRNAKGVPSDATGKSAGAKVAVPMRRRSWQQINRMLEFESGVKKREA